MRESFRLQQQLLGPSFSGIGYFIYNDKEEMLYKGTFDNGIEQPGR